MIGIIAGRGDLPILLANECSKNKLEHCVIAIDDSIKLDSFISSKIELIKIGNVGKIISLLKKNKAKQIILAGGLTKPNFKELEVDLEGGKLLATILKHKFLGDDNLLKIVANYLEDKGLKVMSATDLIPSLTSSKANLTNAKPSSSEQDDIAIGIEAAKLHGKKDLGQAVIARDKIVVGCENKKGTDKLIEKFALDQGNKTGILVKVAKPQQDLRLDMPTIGPETVLNIAKNNYSGIAIEAGKVIILHKEKVIDIANQYGIFIVAI